jgi:hypothetical protein
MLRYLFYAFLIYLAYRLVFHLIIPIYRTSKQVKKQFREMHERMHDQVNEQKSYPHTSVPKPEANKQQQAGDYIDFEEVK